MNNKEKNGPAVIYGYETFNSDDRKTFTDILHESISRFMFKRGSHAVNCNGRLPTFAPFRWLIRTRYQIIFMLFLLSAALWTSPVEAASVAASKDCSTSPCTVVTASFTIIGTPKTIHWAATYNGSATQGHSFYLTTNPASNMADIALTTSGQASGTMVLTAGTYYISIKLALMGPGTYSITYNPSSTGEPHITTIDGARYDFQAAGEFVLLREPKGLEIQVRQTPIATKPNPGDENATCVSVNTAVAAKVGSHRLTYEPNLNGIPDPSGLQLRVDGRLTDLDEGRRDFGGDGSITRTNVAGGLMIEFPDGTHLIITPGWWADQGKWYLNLDITPASDGFGLAGAIGTDTWLPALPDGSSMGPPPQTSHDRYVALNQKFAEAWRVTDATSIFDYAPGTSTATFTNRNWPSEHPPCDIPGILSTEPITEKLAKAACQGVRGSEYGNCVYDVMVTGNPGFATTYAASQSQVGNSICEKFSPKWIWILLGLLLGVLIAMLIYLLRRMWARPN